MSGRTKRSKAQQATDRRYSISLEVNADVRAQLDRLTKHSGIKRSHIVRVALERLRKDLEQGIDVFNVFGENKPRDAA